MKKTTLTLALAATLSTLNAPAADAPLWMRNVKASPDGKTIAFRYKGDIFTVPITGGRATRITTDPAMDRTPVWSPDSRSLAFASNRDGAMNIYVVDTAGGPARRVTNGSASLDPLAFSPDGSEILYSASIQDPVQSRLFPSARLPELYSVPVTGGVAKQILASPVIAMSWLPDGKSFVYQDQKGMEDTWRKHHTSSVTRDIWLYDANSGRHTNLTNIGGEDLNPVVGPDGKTVYFLSERNGATMNIYSMPLDNPKAVKQETNMTTHPVRFVSVTPDGTLVFAYDGEIYTQRPGAEAVKLPVTIVDDIAEQPSYVGITTFDEAFPSPDGKQVAAISRGNIFVTSTDFATTKQITDFPGMQKMLAWHPDGRKIAFVSDKDGDYDIYTAEIARDGDLNFANATLIDIKPLRGAKAGVERSTPKYSPDGKKLAYVENRKAIKVIDLATGDVKQITDGSMVDTLSDEVEFEWSPDGKWIVTTINQGQHTPYYDIALINVATGNLTNLTGSGYFDMSPKFAFGGNAIIFASDRRGMRNQASWGSQNDVMAIFLNQEAFDKYNLNEEEYKLLKEAEKNAKKTDDGDDNKKGKKDDKKAKKDTKKDADKEAWKSAQKDIKVQLDGIRDRIVYLTPTPSKMSGFIVTGNDGEEVLYFMASFENGYDLWKKDLRKGDVKVVNKLDAADTDIIADKEGKTLFLVSSKGVKKMSTSDERPKGVTFSGRARIDHAAERAAMFDFVKREEGKRFYNTNMHGIDWDAMTEAYRKFVPHINNNFDFAEMLSELLGELNVSHTGARYFPAGSKEPSAVLGLIYDLTYTGKGMKVAEVLRGTPFAKATSQVRPGMVIESIQGVAIDTDNPVDILLKRLAGTNTLVGIYDPTTGKRWEETVKPITASRQNEALYQRWVERNRQLVDSLSDGRLGYLHIRSMDDPSYRNIYADLLGRYYNRDGVIIDTRWNGGGRLHEDIEVLFSGDKYFEPVVRGQVVGQMPSKRWNKPSIMIQGEANYSNAHGTPWVYKHKGLGKLVGAPVPGTMTSVNWVDLRDPSMLFGIPVVGMRIADGSYLENKQLNPDILVLNDPAEVVAGRDSQIEAAVTELLKEIDK